MKTWKLRVAGVLALVVAVGGTWVGYNFSSLRARYATQQLTAATTDEERAKWADKLVQLGAPGFDKLIGLIKAGDEPARAAACAALERHLSAMPDSDTRAVTIGGSILDAFPFAGDAGKLTVLQLVPTILKRTGSTHAQQSRVVVAEGLTMPEVGTRLHAVRLAIHPDIQLRAELLPLLAAKEPEVRGATLFAVASVVGEPIIGDEELFKFLHDSDESVRQVCHDALVGRDRTDAEISLGKRLTHSDPTERLKLLMDLRYDNDVADPEPWLERLSRDPEPAVRAGAARVMVEIATARKLSAPVWVARVADGDHHPTVRFIAGFYRALPSSSPRIVIPANGP